MWIFIAEGTCVGGGKLKIFGSLEALGDLVTENRGGLFQGDSRRGLLRLVFALIILKYKCAYNLRLLEHLYSPALGPGN